MDKSIEIVKLFNPDVIVHVLRFDVYKDDPQAKCHVSTQGFKTLATKVKSLNKPVIILVEGSYCIEKLNENLQAFLSGLISKD
ncbi:Acetylpolyamine aminohydrolase [Marinobacter sp. BSs20148]|nr:Acetylpolyamine aminohydrolase [Marinobacter sp. BSs20148]